MININFISSYNDYNDPWRAYLFKAQDVADLSQVSLGQEVELIVYVGGIPFVPGTGTGTLLSFVYADGLDLYLDSAPGRTLIGFIILDSDGVLLQPNNAGKDDIDGQIQFADSTLTVDEKNEICFDKLVWNKQCIFAKDVLKFVNEISFGYFKPEALECLKEERRKLLILNAYDPRDIENETTNYNVFTYKQIKKLLK
jgi:hypothetical protein